MKRALLCVLLVTFALVGYGISTVAAQETKEHVSAHKKGELRWHGVIVRINQDKSTMDVRKANNVRTIHFDSATKWTKAKGKAAADMSEFKEGADVICLGKAGEKGEFVATEVVLNKAA